MELTLDEKEALFEFIQSVSTVSRGRLYNVHIPVPWCRVYRQV